MEFLLNPAKQYWKKFQKEHHKAAVFISMAILILLILGIIIPLSPLIPHPHSPNNSEKATNPPASHDSIIIIGDTNQVQKTEKGNITTTTIKVNILSE